MFWVSLGICRDTYFIVRRVSGYVSFHHILAATHPRHGATQREAEAELQLAEREEEGEARGA